MGSETQGIEVRGRVIIGGEVGDVVGKTLESEVGGFYVTTLGYGTGYGIAMEYLHCPNR